MSIDLCSFHLYDVTDTCAVWNVLSSMTLFTRARDAGVVFICPQFVVYECLHKQRTTLVACDTELQSRLGNAQKESSFVSYPLDIADLQAISLLENRKRLGKGELSAMAFALKTRQAFLTDDQKARKLAREVLELSMTQTTPHLLGWLFFTGYLNGGDKDVVISDHQAMKRPLTRYFEEMYVEACRCRLMARQGAIPND
jgi:hypothetical protein